MKAYINYPQPNITIHWNDNCPHVMKHHKVNQRIVRINAQTIEESLARFVNRKLKFAPNSGENDMWIEVSLGSPRHDEAVIYVIHSILGIRYTRLKSASIENHGCPDNGRTRAT
jgi:hypothetical protein